MEAQHMGWDHFAVNHSDDGDNNLPLRELCGGNTSTALSDIRRYDFMISSDPVAPQLYHGSSNQSLRGPCANHSHRFTLAFRPSNNVGIGNASLSEVGLRSVDGATVIKIGDLGLQMRDIGPFQLRQVCMETVYEGFVDRSALHASRSTFYQHRDLRLDIDNMSYEELLALGERIGTVNTGLSEDSIFNCLKKTTYCPLDQMQPKEICVICLEAYEEGEDVGTLKTCSHHYHVNCIKRWLSMKNSCPICKASALVDDLKEK
ncbi:hypothetical protein SAY86_025255 [Trapa natans]|uniref:RING-type E3 ubiquitin transferase n=1 Tax=Trapa natans TaxID=22666 RepID=A0AAN7M5X6_TRANT|nr:hypothetical protein SAY86_025255 [Trapa natans]